jgi:hypothetical protein
MRGRVTAVEIVFIVGSNEFGELESGTLAALIGAVPTVVAGGPRHASHRHALDVAQSAPPPRRRAGGLKIAVKVFYVSAVV